jgi:hypothetical protein
MVGEIQVFVRSGLLVTSPPRHLFEALFALGFRSVEEFGPQVLAGEA